MQHEDGHKKQFSSDSSLNTEGRVCEPLTVPGTDFQAISPRKIGLHHPETIDQHRTLNDQHKYAQIIDERIERVERLCLCLPLRLISARREPD